MKTADSENPNHGVAWPRNRAHGAVGQNRSRLIKWAEKQEKFQPKEVCFFLTSPFIELTGHMNPGYCQFSSSERNRPRLEASFVTEGHEWIGLRRAAGRQEARGQARRHNDGHDSGKCGWVCDGNAWDLAGEEARECIACEKAAQDASHHKTEAVEKHEPKNISRLSSQRHANANLASLQGDRVAHHAVHADDYQDQADDRECREGYQFKLWPAIKLAQGSLQRSRDADGDARIYRLYLPRHASQNCARIHRGSGHNRSPVKHLNAVGDEGFRKFLPRRIFIVARLVIRHDPDDFKISITRGIAIRLVEGGELDLAAERIFVGKILTSESLVYDHDVPACVHVVLGEIPATEQRYAESFEIVLADGFKSGLPAFRVGPARNDNVRRIEFQRRFFIAFRGREYTGDCSHSVEKLARY